MNVFKIATYTLCILLFAIKYFLQKVNNLNIFYFNYYNLNDYNRNKVKNDTII
jgi:hypothetical protein